MQFSAELVNGLVIASTAIMGLTGLFIQTFFKEPRDKVKRSLRMNLFIFSGISLLAGVLTLVFTLSSLFVPDAISMGLRWAWGALAVQLAGFFVSLELIVFPLVNPKTK